ncbi:Rossmann-fold NAD(P)-binding domain-containing protein [Flindersiella endophytica]
MDVLISGASIAGPIVAYWLRRYGFRPVVVERTEVVRIGLGGHAIDLFGPAVDIAERMGVLPEVEAARTRNRWIVLIRPGKREVRVDGDRLSAGLSERHIELLRGELARILYDATKDDVEYILGDSIKALHEDADGIDVEFDSGPARRFDLVIGADGLHSNVRRLAFGDEKQFLRYIGGYLGIFSMPNYLNVDNELRAYIAKGKLAGVTAVWQTGEGRAGFFFRRKEPFDIDHRDVDAQKKALRERFADEGWEILGILSHLDDASDFYFDSISQVVMDSWSRGRVTLVGDAGYSPAPAVGGGSSVAAVGAYILAGELAAAGGDHVRAFAAYEREMRELVVRTRQIAPSTMGTIIPGNSAEIFATVQLARVFSRLPKAVQRAISALGQSPTKVLNAIQLKSYQQAGTDPAGDQR